MYFLHLRTAVCTSSWLPSHKQDKKEPRKKQETQEGTKFGNGYTEVSVKRALCQYINIKPLGQYLVFLLDKRAGTLTLSGKSYSCRYDIIHTNIISISDTYRVLLDVDGYW